MQLCSQQKQSSHGNAVVIRPAVAADAAGIRSIMACYIQETTCNWRYQVMDLVETQRWLEQHMASAAHKVWVGAAADQIVAYGCLSDFRAPEAYHVCAEDSVYVLPSCSGQGIGTRLMEKLIRQAIEQGLQTLVAAIDASNESSIRFHEQHGFVRSGVLKRVGYKNKRWLDLLLMTCDLNQPCFDDLRQPESDLPERGLEEAEGV